LSLGTGAASFFFFFFLLLFFFSPLSSPTLQLPYLDHYHPSVASFAKSILDGKRITYVGNPLQDFTLIRFLDKFVYKNPKKEVKSRGSSIMQPTLSVRAHDKPMNTKNFGKAAAPDVDTDEVGSFSSPLLAESHLKHESFAFFPQLFFQKFFVEKKNRAKAKDGKDGKEEDDDPFAMGGDDDDEGVDLDEDDLQDGGDDEDEDVSDEEDEVKEKPTKKKGKQAAKQADSGGEEEDEDEDSDDDDEIYKKLQDLSEDELEGEDFEESMKDEKYAERMLLKGITDENFGDEDFDDGNDNDDEDVDLEDGDNEDGDEEVDDEEELSDQDMEGGENDDDDDDDEPFPFGEDDDEDDDDDDEGSDEGSDKGKGVSKKRKRSKHSPSSLLSFYPHG